MKSTARVSDMAETLELGERARTLLPFLLDGVREDVSLVCVLYNVLYTQHSCTYCTEDLVWGSKKQKQEGSSLGKEFQKYPHLHIAAWSSPTSSEKASYAWTTFQHIYNIFGSPASLFHPTIPRHPSTSVPRPSTVANPPTQTENGWRPMLLP